MRWSKTTSQLPSISMEFGPSFFYVTRNRAIGLPTRQEKHRLEFVGFLKEHEKD